MEDIRDNFVPDEMDIDQDVKWNFENVIEDIEEDENIEIQDEEQ